MTIKQKELYNVLESLPEELSNKVVNYIKYLKFSYMTNNAPDELIIKDDKDLLNKLKKVFFNTYSLSSSKFPFIIETPFCKGPD